MTKSMSRNNNPQHGDHGRGIASRQYTVAQAPADQLNPSNPHGSRIVANISRRWLTPFMAVLCILWFSLAGFVSAAQAQEPVDVSNEVLVSSANERSTLDRRTRRITKTADITLTNLFSETISTPLHAVVEITGSGVQMPEALGGPGTQPYDRYYYDLSGQPSDGALDPGEAVTFAIKFVTRARSRFRYNIIPYGVQTPLGPCGTEPVNACGLCGLVPAEICDGIDNNCDSRVDEGFDLDEDGYTSCGGDCDDGNADINPGAAEIPDNGIDDNCDGDATVTVPDILGLDQADAESALADAGLSLGDITQQHSDSVPAGSVVSQLPPAGTVLSSGTPVDLAISLGSADTAPPDVTLGLTPATDTGIPGDGLTTLALVDLEGETEPETAIALYLSSDLTTPIASTTADGFGAFSFFDVALVTGGNDFTVVATDLAGNQGSVNAEVLHLPCEFDEQATAFAVPAASAPVAGGDLQAYLPDSPGFIGEFISLGVPAEGEVPVLVAELNGDFLPDLVSIPETGSGILVFLNNGSGVLAAPVALYSGAIDPTALAAGNFVGDSFPDIAVGHADGTLTFLQGNGTSSFVLQEASTVAGLGAIVDLTAADFDGDGDLDLAISGTDQVNLVLNDNDALPVSPIANGTFSSGLSGWITESTGHAAGDTPGAVLPAGGMARMEENGSFRTTLRQTFAVPPDPTLLSFDIVSLNLEEPAGGIPDAFEISLLDGARNTLVPTFAPNATSFFNANPGGVTRMADGVGFDGTRVTLDISGLAPGTSATLYFDLIGNPPGRSSSVVLDNVAISPDLLFTDTFSVAPLPGPFGATAGISQCDANGDSNNDILVADEGSSELIIYSGDGSGGFARSSTGLMPFSAGVAAEPEAASVSAFSVVTALSVATGELIAGEISVPGEIDTYSLSFSVGQTVYFDVQVGGPSNFSWSLVANTSGTEIFNSIFSFRDRGPLVLPETDTYTLTIQGRLADFTGPYQIEIFTIPDPVPTPIHIGDVVTGAIDIPGETDIFTFSADAGQSLFVDMQVSPRTGLTWTLIDPLGSTIQSRSGDFGNILLSETGQYRLVMDGYGDATFPYQFQIIDVPEPVVTPIAIYDVVKGSIDLQGETDIFTFSADAGQSLFVDIQVSPRTGLTWTLIDPLGSTIQSRSGDFGNILLSETGQYRLVMDGYGAATFPYQFQIFAIPEPDTRAIRIGQTVGDTLDVPGEIDQFSFDATAGQNLYMDIQQFRLHATWTITDPLGTVVNSGGRDDKGPFAITETGRHLLTVDGLGDDAFQYQFQLWDVPTNASRDIPFDTPIHDAITSAGETFFYRFSGVAGQEILFDMIFNPNRVEFILTDPSGNKVFTTSRTDKAGVILPEEGSYELSATLWRDRRAAFSFQVVNGATAPPLLPTADLVVSSISAPARVIGDPASVAVTWTVTNIGTAPTAAAGWSDQIRFSAGGGSAGLNGKPLPRWAETGYAVAAFEHTGILAPGVSYTHTETIPFREGFSGNLQVVVEADYTNREFEASEEGNNILGAANNTAVYPQARTLGGDTVITLNLEEGSEFPVGSTVSLEGRVDMLNGTVNALFVFDVSGSTKFITGLDANADGVLDDADNLNNDNSIGDVLDAEIGAMLRISDNMAGWVDDLLISAIPFARESWPMDLGPDILNQVWQHPAADSAPVPLWPDFAQSVQTAHVVNGYFSGGETFNSFLLWGGTNFSAALRTASAVLDGAPGADQTFVYFMTDEPVDPPTGATDGDLAQLAAHGVRFFAYQIGGTEISLELQHLTNGVDASADSSGNVSLITDPNNLVSALLSTVELAGVAVNGAGVQSLDAAGNFFTPVTIQPGNNVFLIEAFDSQGGRITKLLNLIGTSGAVPGYDAFLDLNSQGQLSYQATTFNRNTRQLHTDMRLTNAGSDAFAAPVVAFFSSIDPPSVFLANGETANDSGHAGVLFDTELGGSALAAGAASDPIALRFANTELQRFSLEVDLLGPPNTPPEISSAPPVDALAGGNYIYPVAAHDADGDTLSFSLNVSPAGMQIDANSGVISWAPSPVQVGSHQVAVQVNDGRGGSAVQSYQLQVWLSLPNRPPLFSSAPITGLVSGADYNYAPVVTDVDGDSLNFSLDTAPPGMTIDPLSGAVNLSAPVDGSYNVAIRVEDGRGGSAVQAYLLSVGAAPLFSGTPLILSTPSTLAVVDLPYLYLPLAQDPEGDTLTFALLTAPAGMSIDPATGRMDWIPSAAQVGPNAVLLQVDDGNAGIATQFFTIEVSATPINLPPVILTTPSFLATENEAYAYDADAIDGNGDPVTYSLLSAPVGMSIGASDGLVDFTPTAGQLGLHSIVISAQDPAGDSGQQAFTLEVRALNTPPVISSDPPTMVMAGENYRYQVAATDAEDDIRFSLPMAPAGMSVDSRNGLIIMATTLADLGDHAVDLRVTDDRGASANQMFTLSVVPDSEPPVVSLLLSQSVIEPGDSIEIQVLATDNVAVDSRSLELDGSPMTLDSNDAANFTAVAPGLLQLRGSAIDSSGNVGEVTQTLRVIDPADTTPPVVEIEGPAPGDTLTYLTDVVGSISGADLEFYRVEFANQALVDIGNIGAENTNWQLLAEGSTEVSHSVLATFDPTALRNDGYVIRVLAQDFSGNIAIQALTVFVAGEAKLGKFALEYTDLSIPLAGIPIKVIRRYDTFDANIQGDFGFAWSLSIGNPDLRETVPVAANEEAVGLFAAEAYVEGTRVYLTNPDGERIGFTFEPTMGISLLGAVFYPAFTPDPGVYDRLEVDNMALSQGADGTFGMFLFGFNYNPEEFRLVRPDGTMYHYNQFTGLRLVGEPNGNELTITDSGIFHSSGIGIPFVRDAEGRITQIIDPDGNTIDYGYDTSGDLISVANQEGSISSYSYLHDPAHYLDRITDPTGRQPVRTEYDADGRIVAISDSAGNRTEMFWDPANFTGTVTDARHNVTTLIYDAQGNILQKTDPLGGVILRTYDANNNMTSIVDQNGNTTRYTYDGLGNVLTETNPLGDIFTNTYDGFGNRTSSLDPLGRLRRWDHDSSGNLVKFTNALGTSASVTYDSEGRYSLFTGFNGNETRYEYDGAFAGPARIIQADGGVASYEYHFTSKYSRVSDENGAVRTYSYNSAGQLILDEDALGNQKSIEYDGHLVVSRTDQRSNTTRFEYDDASRLVQVIGASGGVSEYTYDANGNRTSVTDPGGNPTSFVYDALDRLIQRVDPLGNITGFSYDPAGNLIEITDRNGRRQRFAYDALDHIVRETWLDGSGAEVNVIDRTYDAVGNLLSLTDNFSSIAYTYDALNRVTTADNSGTPGAPVVQLGYEYDNSGNRTRIGDDTGVYSASVYDSRHRLVSRMWNGLGSQPILLDFTYDSAGNRSGATRQVDSGGLQVVGSSSYSYDILGRMTGLSHLDASATSIADYLYTYDSASRLVTESHHGNFLSYMYDSLGQVTESSGSGFGNELFFYDANGNPASATDITGTNNQLLSDGEFDYAYDPEGNLIRKTNIASGDVSTYLYDHHNRLVSVEKHTPTGTLLNQTQYVYDALGRRISSTVDGQTTHYVYDGDNVWADFDASTSIDVRYLFSNEIDEILARNHPAGASTHWYLSDHLGTVRDIADEAGNAINHIDYSTFGKILAEDNPAQTDRYLFTGREFERTTGLYYYRARYYDPDLGRFISEDPSGFEAGDLTLYRYVGNSPQNATDPSGKLTAVEYADLICDIAEAALAAGKIGNCILGLFNGINEAMEAGGGSVDVGCIGGDVAFTPSFCTVPLN